VKVKGVAWLGSPTERFDDMKRFAIDVLGLTPAEEDADFVKFRFPDGDIYEVFGPKAIADGHQFMRAPVAGFLVDDVAQARGEMEAKGVLFIGPVHTSPGFAWSHFVAPDGHVYEITSFPR
jgi:hypothetical protein